MLPVEKGQILDRWGGTRVDTAGRVFLGGGGANFFVSIIYTLIRLDFLFQISTTLSIMSSGSFSGVSIAILIR